MSLDPEDIAAIEQLGDELATALKDGDVSALMDMVTEDAVIIPIRGNIVRGNNIQRYFLFLVQQAQNVKFMALDIEAVGGDAAREVGTFSLRMRGQNPVRIVGSYLFLWQHADGEWKLGSAVLTRNAAAMPGAGRDIAGPA